MPGPLAPFQVIRAAVARGARLGLRPSSVSRAIQRAGFSTRGLNVLGQARQAIGNAAARIGLQGLRGNAVPRPGQGMGTTTLQHLARYQYRGTVTYRLPDGSTTTAERSILTNSRLTVAEARRQLLSHAQDALARGHVSASTPAPIGEATAAELTEALENRI